MHQLQPKHSKLKPEEVKNVLKKYDISLSQLPVIKIADKGLPVDVKIGDVIKIERKTPEGVKMPYYRMVVA